MKKLITFILALLVIIPAFAQTRSISGIVRDEKGSSMPGAIVVVKQGGEKGTVAFSATADEKGHYTVSCKDGDYISVHFLGYSDVVVPVKGKKTIDISMVPDASTRLDDVVVIGYGSTTKADLTGSVTNVKMAEVRQEPVLSIDDALQGRVAGVVITSSDGEPGSEAVIRIRGTRSITATNDPLIVVDGVMDAVASISDINPQDIESISVLKDASSTAIYGARGANGVIIITTKGSADASEPSQNISITFKGTGGVSVLPRELDLMDGVEYGIFRNEYYQHAGLSSNYNMNTPLSGLSVKNPFTHGVSTDWIGGVTRVAPFQSYNLSMNGFAGKQKFYAALAYNNEQGIIKKSGKQNINATLSVTNDLFKWLRLTATLRYQYRLQDNNLTAIGGGQTTYAAQYQVPLLNPESIYNPLDNSSTLYDNALVRLEQITDKTNRSMLTMNVGATVKLPAGFKYRTKVNYYLFDRQHFKYSPSSLPSRKEELGGSAGRHSYGEMSISYEQIMDFYFKKGHHKLDGMVGQTYKYFTSNKLQLEGRGYIVDNMMWNDMGAVSDKDTYYADTDQVIRKKLAVFARANYRYRSRYYLTLTGRFDGASNFAANHKWGFFPSGAFKWVISNEPWIKAEWLDDLSLKLSLGQSGNDLNQPYRSMARLDAGSDGYPFNGNYTQDFWQARIASPNLTWETNTSGNIALEAAFFNNRLSFVAEAYRSVTTDLLLTVKTPHHTGYDDKYENIGRTTSQGVEFTLNSRNIVKRGFTWSTSFTITHSTSMVNDLGQEAQVVSRAAPTGGYMTVGYKPGYPVNSFWGFQYAGVWHNQEEIERNKITHAYANDAASTKLGYPIYVDQNHDGSLNSSDIVYLGSPDPVLSGGLQNSFNYKGFSLGVFFAYSLGGKVFNHAEYYMAGSRRTNQFGYMVNAWHPTKNPTSNLPRAGIYDANSVPSSFQVHDASYLRLKNLTVSYRFNLKSRVLRELELSCSGQNLYLWTNYHGFDPDVSNGSNGYDLSSYPRPLRVVFSIVMQY